MESPSPKRSNAGGFVAIFLALALLTVISFFVLTNLSMLGNFFNLGGPPTNVSQISSPTGSNLTIGYPQSNYNSLVSYALAQINSDRAHFHAAPVTLSPILSGQQHAYSMSANGYFSHWDVNGYKPYMRYSIVNGTGAVEENVAYESCTFCLNGETSVENAIYTLEHDMVYNDSACCQNGHLLNIINPYHNRVSIGIMYDRSHVYFVEDFENSYINFNTGVFSPSSAMVTLKGSTNTSLDPDSVEVFYDPTPQEINASTLNVEYQKPYDQGTFLGGVIPCSYVCSTQFNSPNALTIRPQEWSVTSDSLNIVFSLQQFVSKSGSGVYTIYLTQNTFARNPNETEPLTSISIFVET